MTADYRLHDFGYAPFFWHGRGWRPTLPIRACLAALSFNKQTAVPRRGRPARFCVFCACHASPNKPLQPNMQPRTHAARVRTKDAGAAKHWFAHTSERFLQSANALRHFFVLRRMRLSALQNSAWRHSISSGHSPVAYSVSAASCCLLRIQTTRSYSILALRVCLMPDAGFFDLSSCSISTPCGKQVRACKC